ncbi:MAG: UDP-N-acetylmuramoyl-tripeptide--D-alanyl-D-alanine ligase [Ruminococcus sp.]|nr:UDP-N-acetylmuramoyl-tripeptide--D-alanyl-D-alanine ligase [Ruminococcus sp.]
MEILTLSEIAKAVGSTVAIDGNITEISTDTRTIPKGCLFVAIKGNNFDGHDYIQTAFEKGAKAVISERNVDGCNCILVESTRKALLDIARYYRSKFNINLVGVTGSVGKTTTKEMIALVLSERFNTLKTTGNLNNEIGLPKTLLNLDSSNECAVIEMGMSHFGEISRLTKTALPTMAVITNIGFSHIENLGSQQGILKAKLEILEGMDGSAPIFLNADDISLYQTSYQLGRETITFGIDNEDSDFRGLNIQQFEDYTTFTVSWNGNFKDIKLPAIGKHNVLNALVSFAIGTKLGLTPDEISNALSKYKSDSLRQNIVRKGEQSVIIDCYNASPDSMKASLMVLSQMLPKEHGRRIAVLGDMLELGEMSQSLHSMVGDFVGQSKADILFCYGVEAQNIGKVALNYGKEVRFFTEKSELNKTLKDFLKPNDVILFKASRGMKLEETIDYIFGGKD